MIFKGGETLGVSLQIDCVGRFSNFIIQLSNAISVANRFKIKSIYITPSDYLDDIFRTRDIILCKNLGLNIYFELPRIGFIIKGAFFHVRRNALGYCDGVSIKQAVDLYRHATLYDAPTNRESSDDRNLVIHIRSGDIFTSRNVHQDYGQPPLSYYMLVINHFKPMSITLVYEDESNPVISELRRLLSMQGIPCSVSSSNLREDLKVIMKSSALVIGRGTFALGALCFSNNLKHLYSFSSTFEKDPYFRLHLSELGNDFGVSKWDVQDKVGVYIRSMCDGNWINSDSQRKLMIDYLPENLTLQKV